MKNNFLILIIILTMASFLQLTHAETEVRGTISEDTTWTKDGSPYIVTGNLTIAEGESYEDWNGNGIYDEEDSYTDSNENGVRDVVTLTIEPGVIVKMYEGSGTVTVNGKIKFQGTDSEPIVFTSIKDDTVGGDTNGDGPSQGYPGAWGQIAFPTGNQGESIQYLQVRYGGVSSFYGPQHSNILNAGMI